MKFRNLQPETTEKRLLDGGEKMESGNDVTTYLDNDLVARTRQGDVSAFEELFNRHHKRIYNIAMQMLENEAEAADATQEVFVRAYQRLGGLKADGAFVTWIKTMAANICRDILRRRSRVRVESLDSKTETGESSLPVTEISDLSNNPERILDRKQTQKLVRSAISSLSPDYKEVVTLFYADGADVAEIAKITNSPIGTVKCRLSRARAELKRKLEWFVRDQR
jgi:RNA polymerase sigma-70 factor (ECF subfamily)